MEKQDIFVVIGQVLFAVFGSLTKWLNYKDKKKQLPRVLIIEAITASFSGFLVYFVFYGGLKVNINFAFGLAGLFGYAGARGIDYLFKITTQRLGLNDIDE